MPRLTVVEATKAGFASRPTIYRSVKNGRLSGDTGQDGVLTIDTSELVRVFGEPVSGDISGDDTSAGLELEVLRRENARLKADLDDAKQHRDRLMTLLEVRAELRPSWWRGLFGGRGSGLGIM